MCLILSTAFGDGRVSVEEQEEIVAIAHRSRTLKGMSPNELAAANQRDAAAREVEKDWKKTHGYPPLGDCY